MKSLILSLIIICSLTACEQKDSNKEKVSDKVIPEETSDKLILAAENIQYIIKQSYFRGCKDTGEDDIKCHLKSEAFEKEIENAIDK